MSNPDFDPYHEWLGIPPDEQPANHYRLLGLELFETDRGVIEAVSLEQIAHVRTFAIGANSERSQTLLNELSAARVTLLNEKSKQVYDLRLRFNQVEAEAATSLPPLSRIARLKAVDGATEALLNQDYARALAVLKQLGSENVDEEVEELRATAESFAQEVIQLRNTIQEAVRHGRYDDLLPVVQKYLLLKSEDTDALELQEKLLGRAAQEQAQPLVLEQTNVQSRRIPVKPQSTLRKKADASLNKKLSSGLLSLTVGVGICGVVFLWAVVFTGRDGKKPGIDNSKVASTLLDATPSSPPPPDTSPPAPVVSGDLSENDRDAAPEFGGVVTPTIDADLDSVDESAASTEPSMKEESEDDSGERVASVSAKVDNPVKALSEKIAIPSVSEQEESLTKIRLTFEQQYRTAATREQKIALSREMIRQAQNSRQESSDRYVLLRTAKDIGIAESDADLAIDAFQKIESLFAIDGLAARLDTWNRLLTNTTSAPELQKPLKGRIREQIVKFAQLLSHRNEYKEILELNQFVKTHKLIFSDLVLRQEMAALTDAAQDLLVLAEAREVLQSDPTNPDANETIGRYYCFEKGDWEQGAPFLSRSQDGTLKRLPEMINQGISYLEKLSDRDFGGGDPFSAIAGEAVLIGHAHHKCRHDPDSEAVKRALKNAKAVVSALTKGGGKTPQKRTYVIATCVVLFAEVDAHAYRSELQTLQHYLVQYQSGNGAFCYPYDDPEKSGDVSQSNYALDAFHSLACHKLLDESGFESVVKCLGWLLRTQDAGQNPPGGFPYHARDPGPDQPNIAQSKREMTDCTALAAASSLLLGEEILSMFRERRALRAERSILRRRIPKAVASVRKWRLANPYKEAGIDWYYHRLHDLQQYYTALELKSQRLQPGDEFWYESVVNELQQTQGADGGWTNRSLTRPAVSTAYALLFLIRSHTQASQQQSPHALGNVRTETGVLKSTSRPLTGKHSQPPPANAPFDAATAKEHQEAWAKYLGVEVETENSIGMKLSVTPAGKFTMGEDDDAHEVTLTKPFMLGTYEVTQGQYESVMGVKPSRFKGAKNPVEMVSWNDAVEFCRKLSELPAEKAAGNIYRLPTEAEWEFACRAGTTTKYSFGDDDLELGTYAWFIENAGSKTHPVGGKKPNAWGLYDMHGNVMEWCQDRYGAYPSGAVADPTGAASGLSRVLRDGGYTDLAGRCRSAPRNGFGPGFRMRDRGFRVSLSPSGK